MTDIKLSIEQLLSYALKKLSLESLDLNFVRNQLLDLFKLDSPSDTLLADYDGNVVDLVTPMVDYAISKKLIDSSERELFETKLLGIVTPTPYRINDLFEYNVRFGNIRQATNWFYDLCRDNNYIKTRQIARNKCWSFKGEKGDIMVTINLSKPEKDPKEVAAAKKQKAVGYPKCPLCAENAGYAGRLDFPARQTLRTIPFLLNEENWYMQYSPYQYFDEHCIAFSAEHRPMNVDETTIDRLFDFVELIPHYFIGSNAALPIVGGSILAHEHYQGGKKVQPMFKRNMLREFRHYDYDAVRVGVVDWYNSVLRIRGKNRDGVRKVAKLFLNKWLEHSDKYITAKTTEQHNAVTPIVRMERGEIFVELILRNNITSKQYPYGVFHPAEELHHIKKEAIGIIEVLGLFILPGRLDKEMQESTQYLTGASDLKKMKSDSICYKHLDMLKEIIAEKGSSMTEAEANAALVEYINDACKRILYTTAVYKPYDEEQMQAFYDFIYSQGFVDAQIILDEISEKQRQFAEEQAQKRLLEKQEKYRLRNERQKDQKFKRTPLRAKPFRKAYTGRKPFDSSNKNN